MKKSLVMLLCAVLVVSSVAMGTIAYLTDREIVNNTFTVGKVSIDVDESVVNTDGKPLDEAGNVVPDKEDEEGNLVPDLDKADRTEDGEDEGNKYHMVPGKEYTKDPTVTVLADSEPSYVRMLITLTHIKEIKAALGDDFMPGDHVDGYDATKWLYEGVEEDTDANTATYEFRYFEVVDARPAEGAESANVKLLPLFTSFTVPGELDGEELESLKDFKIIAEGQAIQDATFADADEAWDAFDKQNENAK